MEDVTSGIEIAVQSVLDSANIDPKDGKVLNLTIGTTVNRFGMRFNMIAAHSILSAGQFLCFLAISTEHSVHRLTSPSSADYGWPYCDNQSRTSDVCVPWF